MLLLMLLLMLRLLQMVTQARRLPL
jgi:hypothetical protein